jgi:DNA-binding NarL/FixJ family response regulator
MPQLNGVDAAKQILRNYPAQKILILTDVDSEQVVRDCLDAGVRGWVFKSDGTADLTTAVEALQGDKSVFPLRVSNLLIDSYRRGRGVGPFSPKLPQLSPREREVVQLLAESKTSKEVAMILNISLKTVETHRSNILLKLNLHSVTELVLYAVRNEIVHVQLPSVRRLPRSGNSRKDLTIN